MAKSPPIKTLIRRKLVTSTKGELAPPPCGQLMTKVEVIARLRKEVDSQSLTRVAEGYQIKPQQLSDILYGRANLSKKVLAKINLRMWEFYQKVSK